MWRRRANGGAGEEQERGQPQQQRVPAQARAQEDELAVAGFDEGEHGGVAVAGGEALAHEEAQVAGELGVAVVDRLVLADEAAQLLGDVAGAGLERGVLQHLAGLDGVGGRPCAREEEEGEGGEQSRAHPRGDVTWVPAFAGMTSGRLSRSLRTLGRPARIPSPSRRKG